MLLQNKYVHISACMLALLLCVLAARPFVSMGVCDDWSYIWTARALADTGHLTYNGWATAMLGWQIYLGALFIKLFGFSFTAVRFSVLAVSLLCAALMQRIFVRLGTSESMASVATLSLVLSPLFLPLSFNFMTDIPSLFVLVLCIYCCFRAFQSASDKAALGWLAFAALSNIVGGTVRQIAWLGALVMVPSAAWSMRHRRHMLPAGAVSWGISVLSVAFLMRWFHAQPYVAIEKIFYKYHTYSALFAVNIALTLLTCLLPVMSAFLITNLVGKHSVRNIAAITAAVVGSIFFWWASTTRINYFNSFRDTPFSPAGNYVTLKGVGVGSILGDLPDVVPVSVRLMLTIATFAALASFVVIFMNSRNELHAADVDGTPRRHPYACMSNTSLVMLFVPFTLAYGFLVMTRSPIYDRYLLPLQFIFTLGLIRVYRQTISEKLPRLCLLVGLVYAVYSVAAMHDLFAFDRARVNAANKITATGIPRTAIEGGFDYDAWTQLKQTGYVNEPRMVVPSGAYQPWIRPDNVPLLCLGWFRSYTPSIQPILHLSHQPDNCFGPSQFAPVAYETWLPPRHREIYILESH